MHLADLTTAEEMDFVESLAQVYGMLELHFVTCVGLMVSAN